MKNSTIIKFHIGRGGQYYNQGHLSFKRIQRIDEGDVYNSLFLNEETKEYYTETGSEVGLTEEEAATGIGRIDIDGDYDTTYTTTIKELTKKEIEVLKNDSDYDAEEIIQFLGGDSNR